MTSLLAGAEARLAADTAMGPVTLLVADLDVMTRYYTEAIPLTVLSSEGDTTTVGRGGQPVVILKHAPQLTRAAPGSAGLYHTAILFETQAALAAALYSVARRAPGSFTGSADHLVSIAFYFTDPEGNGVELYWDRSRTLWTWSGDRVQMGSTYIDPNAFLREHLTERGAESPASVDAFGGARVGHVHLSVGDLETARDFYVNTVGFNITAEFQAQALFVSAGGYHHHLGMNVWNSRGAGVRSPALGLGRVDIEMADASQLVLLEERLRQAGVQTRNDGATVGFDDPWANLVMARVPSAS